MKQTWNTITAEFVLHYSILGAYAAPRARKWVPYAERVAYAGNGRHHATRETRTLAWAVSRLRDLGDSLFGAFVMGD